MVLICISQLINDVIFHVLAFFNYSVWGVFMYFGYNSFIYLHMECQRDSYLELLITDESVQGPPLLGSELRGAKPGLVVLCTALPGRKYS